MNNIDRLGLSLYTVRAEVEVYLFAINASWDTAPFCGT